METKCWPGADRVQASYLEQEAAVQAAVHRDSAEVRASPPVTPEAVASTPAAHKSARKAILAKSVEAPITQVVTISEVTVVGPRTQFAVDGSEPHGRRHHAQVRLSRSQRRGTGPAARFRSPPIGQRALLLLGPRRPSTSLGHRGANWRVCPPFSGMPNLFPAASRVE